MASDRCTRCKKAKSGINEVGLCPACAKEISRLLDSPDAPWNRPT